MNPIDRDATVARYRERLQRHGPGIDAMASGDPARQAIRFDALSAIGELSGASILDLGCGLGDLCGYLKTRGLTFDYTGYDLVPEFVEQARRRHPEARFAVRDVQSEGMGGTFDYVFASQVFNRRLEAEDNVALVADVMRRCRDASRRGVAIDMLTSHVDYREDHLHYYDPADMFRLAKSLTKRVRLVHDYPLYEFALFLYPDFDGWAA